MIVFIALLLHVMFCGYAAAAFIKGSYTDPRDGKTYKTVKLNKQTWLAENLNYEAEGSKCYGDEPANCQKYGRLYSWETALNVCPNGWHLPDNEEWQAIVDFAGGEKTAGKKLKARSGWNSENGIDIFSFSALPGGYGNMTNDNFYNGGNYGLWWSAIGYNVYFAYGRTMSNDSDVLEGRFLKSNVMSVRCAQD